MSYLDELQDLLKAKCDGHVRPSERYSLYDMLEAQRRSAQEQAGLAAGLADAYEFIQKAQHNQVVVDEVFKDAMLTGTGRMFFSQGGVRRVLHQPWPKDHEYQRVLRANRVAKVQANVVRQKAKARSYFFWLNERMREVMK